MQYVLRQCFENVQNIVLVDGVSDGSADNCVIGKCQWKRQS